MSSGIFGLESLLNDLGIMDKELDGAIDQIAKETATMVLDESKENINGPMNPNFKKRKKGSSGSLSNSSPGVISRIKSKLIKVSPKGEVPYPVSVNTGTLKRSLKIAKLNKGQYKVFSDLNIANYAIFVHEGTSKMKARPFLDDGVDKVLEDGKYLDNAADIVENIINK